MAELNRHKEEDFVTELSQTATSGCTILLFISDSIYPSYYKPLFLSPVMLQNTHRPNFPSLPVRLTNQHARSTYLTMPIRNSDKKILSFKRVINPDEHTSSQCMIFDHKILNIYIVF